MSSDMNVGCRALDVEDGVQGARIPVRVLYPTRAPERLEQFGPYPLSVATDAPVEGERLPLVIISHGTGGSPWTYRGMSAHLARAGFVVALPEHPGNSRSDNSLAGTAVNLENRPRHVRLVLDSLFGDARLGPRLSPAGAGVIGHSMGGYTALAVAGGRPSSFPNESPDGQPRAIPVVRDPRVRVLVLLAPASPWFMAEGALAGVDLPILMRTAELDEHTPAMHAEIILRGVPHPERIEHRVVPNAGHFSFQSPFPPAMTSPGFPPSQDPKGFDRAAFQPVLHAEILTFLRDSLGSDARPQA
ncbi:alpha/beta hydrolase [Archangium gephyra]|nr:alpha/beta hydrolase [Archangium gephyra]